MNLVLGICLLIWCKLSISLGLFLELMDIESGLIIVGRVEILEINFNLRRLEIVDEMKLWWFNVDLLLGK